MIVILNEDGSEIGVCEPNRVEPPLPSALQSLLDFWLRLKADRDVPNKDEFDPIEMASVLPNVFLCSVESSHESPAIFFKVHGTTVAEILGKDLTRKYLHDILTGSRQTKVLSAIMVAVERRMPARQRLWSAFHGREFIRVDRLTVPLRGPNGEVDHVLGALVEVHYARDDPLTIKPAP